MIEALLAWMYERMVEDESLDGLLARSALDPSKAAVYNTVPVPVEAKLPYVVISGPITDEPDDTFDAQYRTPEVDLHAYTARRDAGGSSAAPVNAIAERVRELFHRQNFAADITGYRALVIRCSGPVVNDGTNAYGRVVTARCLLTAAT
ncbi:MAG: hypothetical protein M0R75_11585 [Dehalococcoidia bacterium]|nr:hypothetical protein [Dehalococcoidia bacterium]